VRRTAVGDGLVSLQCPEFLIESLLARGSAARGNAARVYLCKLSVNVMQAIGKSVQKQNEQVGLEVDKWTN
jgi:hypothetical protein